MGANDFSEMVFCPLGLNDLDQILPIEEKVYTHPWTRGNFVDSLADGHIAIGLRDAGNALIAYFFAMPVLDELHLLNLAVSQPAQGRGYAHAMLDKLLNDARENAFVSILLEVRVSNQRAIRLYQAHGYTEIGRRKGYYPASGNVREDAIVMRRTC